MPVARPRPGLAPGEEENCVSQTVENIASRVSDLHTWSVAVWELFVALVTARDGGEEAEATAGSEDRGCRSRDLRAGVWAEWW